jgi:hypothetical protein
MVLRNWTARSIHPISRHDESLMMFWRVLVGLDLVDHFRV